jgi:hypothetical protein
MRVSRSGVVAANIGAMIGGVIAASVLGFATGKIWPIMQLPVFFITLVCWSLWGITVVLRDWNKDEIKPVSWFEGREYARSSWTNTILSNLATVLFGFVPASLIAGLVGLLWPEAKWTVFLVLFGLWAIAASVMAVLRDVFRVDFEDKIW